MRLEAVRGRDVALGSCLGRAKGWKLFASEGLKLFGEEALRLEAVRGRGVVLDAKVRRYARKLFDAARALCFGGGAASVWEAARQQAAARKLPKEAGKRDISESCWRKGLDLS